MCGSPKYILLWSLSSPCHRIEKPFELRRSDNYAAETIVMKVDCDACSVKLSLEHSSEGVEGDENNGPMNRL